MFASRLHPLVNNLCIGAYTHHGFIPWDDDFDVMVNASQKDIFKLALESVPDHSVLHLEILALQFLTCVQVSLEMAFH